MFDPQFLEIQTKPQKTRWEERGLNLKRDLDNFSSDCVIQTWNTIIWKSIFSYYVCLLQSLKHKIISILKCIFLFPLVFNGYLDDRKNIIFCLTYFKILIKCFPTKIKRSYKYYPWGKRISVWLALSKLSYICIRPYVDGCSIRFFVLYPGVQLVYNQDGRDSVF